MDYTTLTLPTGTETTPETVVMASLYQALQKLSDPRRGQGKRYKLALILCLIVLAKLAGQTSLSGATQWIRHRAPTLAERFGLSREKMPCQMTYCNVLARVDGKQLDEILSAFFVRWEAASAAAVRNPAACTHHRGRPITRIWPLMAVTLRATTGQAHPVHQLSCYEVATGIVLWHCNVGEKQNEISALKPLITPTLVKGRILTLDAMHTQRALCAQIHRFEGDYLLIAKDNQLTLHEDVADLFEDRTPDRRRWQEAETWNKGHGRLEHRHITCSPDLNDWFAKEWEGIEQVFRLERTVLILKTGKIRHEVVYGLSSLSLREAPPPRMLELVRAHWAIENRLHWRRDVTLGEDTCQTRTGPVPSLLAQLNSAVLSLMDRAGVRNVARQARYFDADHQHALDLLLIGNCSVY